MGLEMLKNRNVMEMLVQISWRLEIRNIVKMTPVLHPGVGVKIDRWLQRCSGSIRNVISWRLEIRNPVKMTPVLHPGVGVKSDRWVWR